MIYIFLTEFSEFLHILNWIFKILKMKKIDFSFFALNFLRKNKWKHFRIWQNFDVVPKLSTLSENLIYHSCYLYISKFDKILMLYHNFQLCLKIWFTTVVTWPSWIIMRVKTVLKYRNNLISRIFYDYFFRNLRPHDQGWWWQKRPNRTRPKKMLWMMNQKHKILAKLFLLEHLQLMLFI